MLNIDKLFGENVSYLQDDLLERKDFREFRENVSEAKNHIEYAIRHFENHPLYCKGLQLALDLLNSYVKDELEEK